MQTLEQIKEKIRANFPKQAQSPCETLVWNRETGTTIVSSCNKYRISKLFENGTATYAAWVNDPSPKRIGGRFMNPEQAKEALQFLVGESPGSVRQPAGVS